MKQALILRNIVLMSFVAFSMSSAFATAKYIQSSVVKPVDLENTIYCRDEEKLKTLGSINQLNANEQVDRIVIQKKTKQLHLISQGRIYKSFNVAFGPGYSDGNKFMAADGRTPEGLYYVEKKQGRGESSYYMSLKVSYPNAYDRSFAAKHRVSAGDLIMIHGFPIDKFGHWAVGETHPRNNWTAGCIAVTDDEIEQIYKVVSVRTAIEICPL
ncbi:hypothetical protein CIK05_05220 [Bdellovibrio sp. qaytius]|nr:hypothetical protein CIK05_05220 [Bdellovibrio sp. qaytius]